MTRKCVLSLAIISFVLCLAQPALANETSQGEKPWKRFNLKLGGSANTTDSTVRLGAKGVGLEVNVEDALNLDTSTPLL